jgi:hypothetical protein
LQHRQVGRLRALEDAAGIDADLMKHISKVSSRQQVGVLKQI